MESIACGNCDARIPEDAKFCGFCGQRQPDEDPAAIATYADALRALIGRTEAWAEQELTALRRDLRVRPSTHARLAAEFAAPVAAPIPVSCAVDATTLRDLRAGEQGLVRVRVRNEGPRPIASVKLQCSTTAGDTAEVTTRAALGPGDHEIVHIEVRPAIAGTWQLAWTTTVRSLLGQTSEFHTENLPFRVAPAGALQQSIHIDARSQRVGIFENIGVSEKGGLVSAAEWQPVPLSAGAAPPPPIAPALPPVGRRGQATIVAGGAVIRAELDGVHGTLVELDDPALRGVLAPGDRLTVTVIGHDGAGGLVLSTRSPAAPAPAAGTRVRVGPGDSLADALSGLPDGGTIALSGSHTGPYVITRRVEMIGDGTIEAARGPVLKIKADATIRGISLRGAAPAGAYAVDVVEVGAGRVQIENCTLQSDAPGNLTPGRAVVVGGRATVELRDCIVRHSGIGVSVDVSWSGFATDVAAGGVARVFSCRFEDVGVAVAVAGSGREAHVARCTIAARDAAVRVLRGATAVIEDNTGVGTVSAEPGASVTQRGNR